MDKDFKEIGQILVASESASKLYSHYSGKQKADFLRQIAVEIEHLGDNLIETAANESHLPLARLIGERARTTGQLRLFAEFLEEGSWVDAVIDPLDTRRWISTGIEAANKAPVEKFNVGVIQT